MKLIDEDKLLGDIQVVKCKNCVYNKGEVNKKGFLICSANGMDITDYDFCSWGVRKEDVNYENK